MDFKLELVLVPVSDVDAANTFYIAKAGFTLDVVHRVSDELRIVQPTPPGSACSTTMGTGITEAAPGSVSARRAGRHQDRGDHRQGNAAIRNQYRRYVSHARGGEGVRTNQPGTCRVPGDSIHPGPGAMRSQPRSPQRGQHMPTTSGRHPFAARRPVCPAEIVCRSRTGSSLSLGSEGEA